jgi:hypothetical protein
VKARATCVTQAGGERQVGEDLHPRAVEPLGVEVPEALAGGEQDLGGRPGARRLAGVAGLGDQDHELAAGDELLDEGAAVGLGDVADLTGEAGEVVDPGLWAEADAAVALRVLDDPRGAQAAGDRGGVGGAVGVGEGGEVHAGGLAGELHRQARGVVAAGVGAGVGEADALEAVDDLDAGAVLVPRAVAQVDGDVDALAGEFGELAADGGLVDEHVDEGVFGHERGDLGRLVDSGEGVVGAHGGVEDGDTHWGGAS